jgi:thioesterase-3
VGNQYGRVPGGYPGTGRLARRNDVKSTTDIRVRGYHVDVFGHVNHARYVEFLEEARWAFFDQHRPVVDRLHARGISHAVVRLVLNYRQAACLGDDLRVVTSIKEVGRSSVVVAQEIVHLGDNRLIADAEITNVFLDPETGRPVSIHGDIHPLTSGEDNGHG